MGRGPLLGCGILASGLHATVAANVVCAVAALLILHGWWQFHKRQVGCSMILAWGGITAGHGVSLARGVGASLTLGVASLQAAAQSLCRGSSVSLVLGVASLQAMAQSLHWW